MSASWRRHLVALLGYAALAAAMTWPLSLHLDSVVPHDLGDPLLSTWTLWWNATVTPLTNRWWNPPIFFPASEALTLSDHRLGLSVIATPIIWVGASPLLTYNLLFISSFVLSAFSAYALCYSLTRHAACA